MALRRAAHLASTTTASIPSIALGFKRLIHGVALPAPGATAIDPLMPPSMKLPETGAGNDDGGIGFRLPGFGIGGGGAMELMAVPKKKKMVILFPPNELDAHFWAAMKGFDLNVSRHKRGIRNGPKALKPIPVIIRCKCCGKVRLPHFYCCGGRRDEADEKAG
ncbi:hypothetical protein AKJ16_DCAP10804 [Drosera capensis]